MDIREVAHAENPTLFGFGAAWYDCSRHPFPSATSGARGGVGGGEVLGLQRGRVRVSEDDREIKVTDKRIFTPEGELREGFEHLDAPESAPEPRAEGAGSEPAKPAASSAPSEPAPPPQQASDSLPPAADGLGAPTFSRRKWPAGDSCLSGI